MLSSSEPITLQLQCDAYVAETLCETTAMEVRTAMLESPWRVCHVRHGRLERHQEESASLKVGNVLAVVKKLVAHVKENDG